MRRLRAEREHPSNRKNVEPKAVQMQAKNTKPRKLEKTQKGTVWEATMSPKIDPGGLRERLGRLLRATSAPRALQKRSWRPPGAEKSSKGAPGRNFQRDWQKTGIGRASGGTRSAVLAEPVKAYPGGFRPGKTRLNDFKHAHHRKRWSAD